MFMLHGSYVAALCCSTPYESPLPYTPTTLPPTVTVKYLTHRALLLRPRGISLETSVIKFPGLNLRLGGHNRGGGPALC